MNKTTLRLSVAAGLFALMAGCASVAVTSDSLEQRTAAALNLDRGSFTISNRVDEGVKTSYVATTKTGKTYSCYVTGGVSIVGRAVSDAICTDTTRGATSTTAVSGKTGSACNALLKAAGKC